jgi:hypothetical protein
MDRMVCPKSAWFTFWLAPPLQLQICVRVALAELLSVTSRHLPARPVIVPVTAWAGPR